MGGGGDPISARNLYAGSHICRNPRWWGSHICRKPRCGRYPISAGKLDGEGDPIPTGIQMWDPTSVGNLNELGGGEIPYLHT